MTSPVDVKYKTPEFDRLLVELEIADEKLTEAKVGYARAVKAVMAVTGTPAYAGTFHFDSASRGVTYVVGIDRDLTEVDKFRKAVPEQFHPFVLKQTWEYSRSGHNQMLKDPILGSDTKGLKKLNAALKKYLIEKTKKPDVTVRVLP